MTIFKDMKMTEVAPQNTEEYLDFRIDIPNFTYDSSISVYKDMKMTEVAPQNTEEYLDFRISPVLPAGIVLDANTGWISGTPTVVSGTQTYTITGTKMSGGDVSATLTLTVVTCSGDKG
ncbi:hypothetical protein JH06_5933, partial [Blastocystis sp. subtype 4]|uniref:hypothetical protein n=1 Tax=Blastocystis sp. subtype 4 TaxID=944170 RepID=UPI00071136AE